MTIRFSPSRMMAVRRFLPSSRSRSFFFRRWSLSCLLLIGYSDCRNLHRRLRPNFSVFIAQLVAAEQGQAWPDWSPPRRSELKSQQPPVGCFVVERLANVLRL